MKKAFKYYLMAWAVLLILFNIIAFVSVGWTGKDKYTPSFWSGYVFITLVLIGQMICAYFGLKENDIKKTFYNVSIVTTSYIGLILSFVFGGLCMIISPLPYWVGIILCAVILALNVIAMVKASAAIDFVKEVDEKIKVKTFFIKSLTVDAESLMNRAKSEFVKSECKKVYDAIRYSDPMSSDTLSGIESQITIKFAEFDDIVKSENSDIVKSVANELIILVEDRNKKCRLLKGV